MKLVTFLKDVRRLYNLRRASDADPSYAGEFGQIDRLLKQIGIEHGYVVDIAASDGVTQSSTLPLFQRGWAGLAVEMSPRQFAGLAHIYADFGLARLARSRVTPLNVAALLGANEVPAAFDLLNLDIDSYDLAVLGALLAGGYRPKLVSMEINEKIPASVHFAVEYDEGHYWKGDHFYGCSLAAAGKLMRANDYILEGVEYNNALFVARECAAGIVDVDNDVAYRAGYLDRPDRKTLFPWNADMETLQSVEPAQAVAMIDEKFAAYRGLYALAVS